MKGKQAMEHSVNNRSERISWSAVLIVLFLIIFIGITNQLVYTQVSNNTLAEQFRYLMNTQLSNATGETTVQFVHPLFSQDRPIVLPQQMTDSGVILSAISEVGTDYVCFEWGDQGTRYKECIPYSNIASISYPIESR